MSSCTVTFFHYHSCTGSPTVAPTAPTSSPSMRPTVTPPINDDCASAIAIVYGLNGPPFNNYVSLNRDTIACYCCSTAHSKRNFPTNFQGATTSSPPFNCTDGGLDVWFVYTANASGTLSIDTCTGTTCKYICILMYLTSILSCPKK